MPKRHSDERQAVGRKANRRRHHLYLVMNRNDGEEEYAVRKVDLLLDDDAEQPHRQRAIEQRLPPALICFKALASQFFASIGTKILVTNSRWPKSVVPIFDVRTRQLTLVPWSRACTFQPIYMPVGNKLFSLDYGCSKLLYPPPEHIYCDWDWRKLRKPSFNVEDVTSHVAHPDGRTIFVSVKRGASAATFILDTESENMKWKRHGKWGLPFSGQAHFDHALGAWVGLSGQPDMLGYLCSCDVVSTDANARDFKSLHWKHSNEKIFCEDPAEKHIGAKVIYMGGRSNFCIVHYFYIKDEDEEQSSANMPRELEELQRPRRCMLRLTTFSLDIDKNGNLRTDTHRQVRCYKLPRAATILDDALQHPVAFWM